MRGAGKRSLARFRHNVLKGGRIAIDQGHGGIDIILPSPAFDILSAYTNSRGL
jgi:hypothetical protein